MRSRRVCVFMCVGLVWLFCLSAEAKDESGNKTIVVNCDKGDSINEALEERADKLIIKIRGTCQEDVVIERDDVTLRGVGPDATVVAEYGPAIWVVAVSRITLENLTVSGGYGPGPYASGIFLEGSSGVFVSNVTAKENKYGLRSQGSSLTVEDSNFVRNIMGLHLNSGSSVVFDGEEINIHENSRVGLVVGPGSALGTRWSPGPRVLVNDNNIGIQFQLNSEAWFGGPLLEVKRNQTGIIVSGSSSVDVSWTNLEATQNGCAISVSGGAVLSASGIVSENQLGLRVESGQLGFSGLLADNDNGAYAGRGGLIHLGGAEVTGSSDHGVVVHGAIAVIQDSKIQENAAGDVDLSFGARVSFEGANDVGNIVCDDTVLVEGDVSCPAAKSLTSRRIQIERVPTDRLRIDHQMTPRFIP